MGQVQQTVERRQLGLALQRLRTQAGLGQQDAANAIRRSAPRISQVEHGKGSLSVEELRTLLDLYGVVGDERETLLALGTQARKRRHQPWQVYTDLLPDAFQRLADLQADATAITYYETGLVPGLAQSPDYVRAIITSGDGVWWPQSPEETERRIAFRLNQQRRVLTTDGHKHLDVIFTEDALRNIVGSQTVMAGQAAHLLQLTTQHSNVTVRIVPSETVDNPGLGGGLMLLDFAAAPSICHLPTLYGPGTYFDQPDDIEPMRRLLERVQSLALSPAETKSLLLKATKES
ncbi:helix-turn-helix domain-containing protein [Streptoalloteichus hindustanus]|uniref:Helix-turn-helix domain-containing protein n=1 Tax=Streptoalloteichus hindustanus TaxID=2017 RepID=A0A1M5PHR4_STRHI|nr:helix-turn-helix transcriptional regulator [Streptoalloteichus hindustanus]SHH01029.1 Helix-turn-helix domain-containing protein [Streptoalloteichus hindustanus]